QAAELLLPALRIPHPVASREERRGVPCAADRRHTASASSSSSSSSSSSLLRCLLLPLALKPDSSVGEAVPCSRISAALLAPQARSASSITRLRTKSTSGPLQ
ncbi:hypothetical protein INR49_032846, partial [Caranx melampygus]